MKDLLSLVYLVSNQKYNSVFNDGWELKLKIMDVVTATTNNQMKTLIKNDINIKNQFNLYRNQGENVTDSKNFSLMDLLEAHFYLGGN